MLDVSEAEVADVNITSDYADYIERIYSLLSLGYSYLFKIGNKDGHWNEIRSTALAGMCLEIREHGNSPWLQTVRNYLLENQIKEGAATGSWGEEIWDTAMSIIALKSFGVSSRDQSIQQGLQWIASLFSINGRDNWHDEPWETSWALLAILTSGLKIEQVDILKAVNWLMGFQDDTGRIISPHYTAYFILISSKLDKVDMASKNRDAIMQVNQNAFNCLIGMMRESDGEKLWTGEAWSNGQILWAIAKSKLFPILDKNLLNKTISWFELTQTQDGNWSDVEDTSSAMLGLYSLLELLILNTEGSRSVKDIYKVIQKRIPSPPLYIRQSFIKKNTEIGGVTINISNRAIKTITIMGLLATILATIAQLLDFIWNHWIK